MRDVGLVLVSPNIILGLDPNSVGYDHGLDSKVVLKPTLVNTLHSSACFIGQLSIDKLLGSINK